MHAISEDLILNVLIDLCDNLAWGRPANENLLFDLTAQGAAPEPLVRLAEAFGMMFVKVEGREFFSAQLINELKTRNAELEEAREMLSTRNAHLMNTVQEVYQTKKVVGQCEGMRAVIDLALSIARRPINTLLLGPTGAGKEAIARLIHYSSPRRDAPFMAVNCTAIPDSLFESEMFGIEKGIATGVASRRGLVEEAQGGTLFLDELADMTLPNQAKLLRVIEERQIMRVGSAKPVSVDINFIAATNVHLEQAVRAGTFREDLYYRINVVEVSIPPLCERGDDILLLARMFLDRHCTSMGRQRLALSRTTQKYLLNYPWPGNVRELNNEMERAAALTLGDKVELTDLSQRMQTFFSETDEEFANLSAVQPDDAVIKPGSAAFVQASPGTHVGSVQMRGEEQSFNLQEFEGTLIAQALEHTDGNRSRAAVLLGITREGLRKKLLRMGYAEK